jgi:alginate O-acetyltransferase complex protein AlgI
MLFFSLEFYLFFIFFLVFIICLNKFQRLIIIIFSLLFYSFWNFYFIPLIIFFCLSTILMLRKNYSLIISILILIIPLLYFKYSFFIFNLLNLEYFIKYTYTKEIPLALSFITFSSIAAVIDRRNKLNNEYTLSNISEFILYFPHLIAGPILRLHELIPQLKKKIIFSVENIKFGLIIFCIGYIKKVYFADGIAGIIDPIFKEPHLQNNKDIIKAFLLFPIQIYFDFSGYIDMALGISKILGIDLPQNFNRPYLSSSLTEFWRRWHITLSKWFRDYLYIPLGGSKAGMFKKNFNLLLTMTIAGIWHGASLNFILWGFLNGVILCLEKQFGLDKSKYSVLKNFFTCFLIFNLWIVFRISDFSKLKIFFDILYSNIELIFIIENLIALIFVISLIFFQKIEILFSIKEICKKINALYIFLFTIFVLVIGYSISLGQQQKFIYFQF